MLRRPGDEWWCRAGRPLHNTSGRNLDFSCHCRGRYFHRDLFLLESTIRNWSSGMEQNNNAAQETEAMISLRDLRVSYGEREILHGISFDVIRGETMVILGGSGSGKSTLFGLS